MDPQCILIWYAIFTRLQLPFSICELRQVPQLGLIVPLEDGLLKHVAQDIFELAQVLTSSQTDGFPLIPCVYWPFTKTP